MIYDNAEEFGGKEKYGPLREVLLLLNNFIDIMNGRKNVFFSSPDDENLDELLKLFPIFSEWKDESLSNKKELIPIQPYEDVCWICFAKIGIFSKYYSDQITSISYRI